MSKLGDDAMNLHVPRILGHSSQAQTRAGGSSFYFAMRILERSRREAMFEVYSFCRAVDDIADCDAPHEQRLVRLAEWRRAIDALYCGTVPAGLDGLARVIERFDLRKEDFLAVIDGVEMDARENIHAPTLETVERYCDCVACAVGRLSVRIFGMEEEDGRALAHHLGRALQFTNILRDIDEDAAVGRLYLPREALALARIDSREPKVVVAHPRLDVACNFIAARARYYFDEADAIMARSPHRLVRAPKIMSKVYHQLLTGMVARGWSAPRHRVHVNKPHLVWIALRHAII
jgi:squalene synthase HpnD